MTPDPLPLSPTLCPLALCSPSFPEVPTEALPQAKVSEELLSPLLSPIVVELCIRLNSHPFVSRVQHLSVCELSLLCCVSQSSASRVREWVLSQRVLCWAEWACAIVLTLLVVRLGSFGGRLPVRVLGISVVCDLRGRCFGSFIQV